MTPNLMRNRICEPHATAYAHAKCQRTDVRTDGEPHHLPGANLASSDARARMQPIRRWETR